MFLSRFLYCSLNSLSPDKPSKLFTIFRFIRILFVGAQTDIICPSFPFPVMCNALPPSVFFLGGPNS